MARPLRIEYQNACYHVMNRGAARQKIFKNRSHRLIFLALLNECYKIFNVKISAYCLMDNHYHLLLSTPEANLSRVMRHLNGVYTQKYNYLQKTDGPLFRGRYKAQLIEDDSYQLIVSRYIHLNPVEARVVADPADYEWSSYSAYIGLSNPPDWLSVDVILKNLADGKSLAYVSSYKNYVEEATLEETDVYKNIKNIVPILGSGIFKQKILSNIAESTPVECLHDLKRVKIVPGIAIIIDQVSEFYNINRDALTRTQRAKRNLPRLVCMYICRNEYGYSLKTIAHHFGLNRQEGVGASIRKCKLELLNEPRLLEEINMICNHIANMIDESKM